jgi:hypothetical protein
MKLLTVHRPLTSFIRGAEVAKSLNFSFAGERPANENPHPLRWFKLDYMIIYKGRCLFLFALSAKRNKKITSACFASLR